MLLKWATSLLLDFTAFKQKQNHFYTELRWIALLFLVD